MWKSLIDSDPSAQILTAWIAKEELRKVLALARTGAPALLRWSTGVSGAGQGRRLADMPRLLCRRDPLNADDAT